MTFVTLLAALVLTYFIDGRMNDARLVFSGMASGLVAVALGAAQAREQRRRSQELARPAAGASPDRDDGATFKIHVSSHAGAKECDAVVDMMMMADILTPPPNPLAVPGQARLPAGVAAARVAGEAGAPQRSHRLLPNILAFIRLAPRYKGALFALGSGASCGLFVPAFNVAVHDTFHTLQPTVANLSVWTAFLVFTLGEVAAGEWVGRGARA
jgi:hypothetical protein